MESILTNVSRVGNFTSSKIAALLSQPTASALKNGDVFGSPAKKYIEECRMEREFERSLSTEQDAKPTMWGKLLEARAFDLLGLEYTICSHETLEHRSIEYWKGSPDATTIDTVVDIKCPMTLKSFYQLVKGGTIEYVRANHDKGEDYYWQLVSNSILSNRPFAELIVYMPYKSELEIIRQLAEEQNINWIKYATDLELPFINDNGNFKNINVIRFEVPQSDKDLLTERVELAGKLLNL